jgi:hypothetical protein
MRASIYTTMLDEGVYIMYPPLRYMRMSIYTTMLHEGVYIHNYATRGRLYPPLCYTKVSASKALDFVSVPITGFIFPQGIMIVTSTLMMAAFKVWLALREHCEHSQNKTTLGAGLGEDKPPRLHFFDLCVCVCVCVRARARSCVWASRTPGTQWHWQHYGAS